jgi:hypothetical protein
MDKCIRFYEFAKQLFDDDRSAEKASQIIEGIIQAQSPRISDIADQMEGNEAANYKMIQRFIRKEDIAAKLKRLFNEEAEYVLVDPTEVERPGAKKTEYVGTLRDGETKGFWMLTLATPLRGRAIPWHFINYSSATLGSDVTSRNLEHQRAIQEVKDLIGKRTMIFDREFSYLGFLVNLQAEGIEYVIRLNQGSHPPQFYYDAERKRELKLKIVQGGGTKIYRQVYYKGIIPVNVVGIWQKGFKKPLWILTSGEPEDGLKTYTKRMKIETSFRDLKSLLHIDKVMNKSRTYLQKMIALVLMAYAMALLVGEAIRDVRYGGVNPKSIDLWIEPDLPKNSKWHSFSGLFLLLKRSARLDRPTLQKIVRAVLTLFSELLLGKNVRSFVST